MFGYLNVLNQLVSLKVLRHDDIQMKSHFFSLIFELYNAMGDKISQQYGSSNAHHNNQIKSEKKKKNHLGELFVSAKRHFNNNYVDPSR